MDTNDLIEWQNAATQFNSVTPQIYTQAFTTDWGKQVLDDLCQRFYAQQSYKRGDPHETSYREGRREVIQFILSQIYQGENPPTESE